MVIEGAELFSKKQQKQEEAALNKSMETVEFDTPSSSSLVQGVPSVVVTYTLFDTSPSLTVLNDEVSHNWIVYSVLFNLVKMYWHLSYCLYTTRQTQELHKIIFFYSVPESLSQFSVFHLTV